MQEIQQNINKYEENEIDFRDMLKTIFKHKLKIIIMTTAITIMAIAYALMAPKIYEATALIEIGSYTLHNKEKATLDDAIELSKRLNILYIDMFKNDKNRIAKINSLKVPKASKKFIDIQSFSLSNESAIKEINSVMDFIQTKHQKILDDVKNRREMEIKNLDMKIDAIKNRTIPLLENKIKSHEETLVYFKKQIKLIETNLKQIQSSNPSLSALKLMEKRDITTFVISINTQLMEMRDKRETLATTGISILEERKVLVASLMLPHNYKNTEVVGVIMTNDSPIKPNKKLIVIVTFIFGFILSLFFVFFLEFIKEFKEEEK